MHATAGQYSAGKIFRDYQIESLIGRGGFAEVYLARQQLIDRRVALKVILPQYANQDEFKDRFDREARIIARMEHPHIVPLYEYWHDIRHGAFIAMRYIDHGTLKKRILTHSFTFKEVVSIMQQIGSALQMAHDNDIVHRDLKPENILFDRYSNAYLTDFGIAKDTNENFTHGLGDVAQLLGSPRYMSPEQVAGGTKAKITPAVDIYTLGILLYELVTGIHPFEGAQPMQMLQKHLDTNVPNVAVDDFDISLHIGNIVQQATFKSPSQRFRSVRMMIRELESALASLPREVVEAPLLANKRILDPEETNADTIVHDSSGNTTVAVNKVVHALGDIKASIYSKPSQVFKRPRKLIGRDALVKRVHQLMDDAEPVLIHGMGGLGKTSLVSTVIAERLKAEKGAVIWLNAGYLDATAMMDAIASAFEGQQHILGLTGDKKISTLRELLADKEMPIILDDVWNDQALFQILKVIPLDVPVVITTRNSSPIEGETIDIGVLPTEYALELMGHHARADVSTNDHAKSLCELLGNHTFALELAGKHLRQMGIEHVETLLKNLQAAPHKAQSTGKFADIGRQSIEDLMDESYAALTRDAQRLLMALGGLDALDTSVTLVKTILEWDEATVRKHAETLALRGLITIMNDHEFTTLSLHSLTHSYAKATHEYSPYRGKVQNAVRAMVDAEKENFDLLEFEQRNILGAIQRPHTATMTRIDVIKVLVLGGYLRMRGHSPALKSALDSAIHDAIDMNDKELLHNLYSKKGNIEAHVGNWPKAVYAYRSALDLAVELNIEDRIVILSCVLASAMMHAGEPQSETDNYLEHAHSLALALDDSFLQGYVLETRGVMAAYREDFKTAADYFTKGVDIARKDEDDESLYYALLNLGTAKTDLKDYEAAKQYLTEALELARPKNHKPAVAEVLESIGRVHHHNGEDDTAKERLEEAYDLFVQSGLSMRAEVVKRFIEETFISEKQ